MSGKIYIRAAAVTALMLTSSRLLVALLQLW